MASADGAQGQINAWLVADRPLRLVRVHELLQRQDVAVGYTTLRRYAQRELGWRKKQPTVRLDDPAPGLEALIDFGLMGTIADEEGHQRRLHVLIVTLSSSRHSFIWPTWRQTTEEVCAGLDAAWRFFGGVPKHVVLDNASAMVVRASATDPGLNRSFREYAESRQFFPDAARVRHPKDKARVEITCPMSVSAGLRVRVREGKRLTTDGPFAETKEQLGGIYLVEAKDLDDAIAMSAKIPGGRYGCVEVRPLMTF